MRQIDADRLLEEKRIETYYHLKNGDIAIPLIDIEHATTVGKHTINADYIKSTAPEIIICEKCENWDYKNQYNSCAACAEWSDAEDGRIRYTKVTDYCSYAERRE